MAENRRYSRLTSFPKFYSRSLSDNNNSVQDKNKNRQRTEAEEWYFRLMNDPNQYEKERFIDSINEFNNVIEEFQKIYRQTTPATDDSLCARILNDIAMSRTQLKRTQAQYEMFKQYVRRTAINK